MKWVCTTHNAPIVGQPFFVPKDEGPNGDPTDWELDQSDMSCSGLDLWDKDTTLAQFEAELERCRWKEVIVTMPETKEAIETAIKVRDKLTDRKERDALALLINLADNQ